MAGGDPLKKLATQVGEIDKRLETVETVQATHTSLLESHAAVLEEVLTVVKQIQQTQGALASSVGLAMTELAIARSLERRVELEAAVFPPKH